MTRKKALIVRKAGLVLALVAAFSTVISETAHAAGLGALTVQSALGQPLRAEIELSAVTPEELQTLNVRLASQQVFKQAGIEFNPALTTLRFSVEKRDGRDVVRISSSQAINEPFLDLLVELNWESGRLVREYTFLLDPPELRLGKEAEQISPVASIPLPAPATIRVPPPLPEPLPVPVTEAKPKPKPTQTSTPSEVKVKAGDSLSKIAARHLPAGVTIDQMLVALYRTNPQSFVGNNMNRLKAGTVLRLPEPTDLSVLPASEARKEVAQQTKDFADYRSYLAGLVAKSTPALLPSPPESKTAKGQITTGVKDNAVPKPEAKDQVKLARPQAGASGAKTGSDGGAAAPADTATAKEKALKEANERVAELERNVGEIEKLLAKHNEAMAKAQEAAKNKTANPSAAPVGVPVAAPPVVAPAPVEAPKVEAPKVEAPKVEAPKVETPAQQPATAKAEQPKPPVPIPAAPPQDGDLLSHLLENPVALGAGALALILSGGGLVWYRRRQAKKIDQLSSVESSNADPKQSSVFATDSDKSLDSADSTFNSRFTPSVSQIDSNEVDPIAEADVYIAYGRDAQAEEILKEALKITPDRHAIHVKLLEIYAGRKDVGAFSSVAGELYQHTNGVGKEWERASELGRSVDSKNPLYTATTNATQQVKAQIPEFPDSISADFNNAGDALEASIPVDFDLDAPVVKNSSTPPASSALSSNVPNRRGLEEAPLAMIDNPGLQVTQPTPALDFSLENSPGSTDVSSLGVSVDPPKLSLDFDLNLPDATAPANEPVSSIDLSGISLDLDSGKTAELASIDTGTTEALDTKQQEMATKLDLAAAYQEIGDREGAKELLDEVIRGGDPTQQARAQKLLDSLD